MGYNAYGTVQGNTIVAYRQYGDADLDLRFHHQQRFKPSAATVNVTSNDVTIGADAFALTQAGIWVNLFHPTNTAATLNINDNTVNGDEALPVATGPYSAST